MHWLSCVASMTPRGRTLISDHFISCTDKCHNFSLFRSADIFHMATDLRKKQHSATLFSLLCIAHALPLAWKSGTIIGFISQLQNFHAEWTLNGWNDGIMQPARDAVLNYYKVRVPISSSHRGAKTHSSELNIFSEQALCTSIRR